MLSTGNIVYE
jgi:arginase